MKTFTRTSDELNVVPNGAHRDNEFCIHGVTDAEVWESSCDGEFVNCRARVILNRESKQILYLHMLPIALLQVCW